MKTTRILLALLLLGAMGGMAYVAQQTEGPGSRMVGAAQKFVESLTADQKAKANFEFDSKERTNWNFVPLEKNKEPTRKGLALKDMTAEQKKAALAILAAGTSAKGNEKALTIMSLESILLELEKGKGPVRNSEWYFVTVFGNPSKTGKWGWRVEGHHLSLNFALDGTQVISATPNFFGANPATVMSGDKKGQRTLPGSDDLARELYLSLDDGQKKIATKKEAFPEPKQKEPTPNVGEPVGLGATKLNDAQRATLLKLMTTYTDRMPKEVGDVEMKLAKDAGLDKVHFAWHGGTKPGEPHSYRVQGPTFVIEFLNIQGDSAKNPANHIHSAWRRIKGDFGL